MCGENETQARKLKNAQFLDEVVVLFPQDVSLGYQRHVAVRIGRPLHRSYGFFFEGLACRLGSFFFFLLGALCTGSSCTSFCDGGC